MNNQPSHHSSKQKFMVALMFIGIGLATFLSVARAQEANFNAKMISYLGGGDSRPCVFFTLENVPEATPLVAGSPWFVLPKTHPKFKETFALLLTAKLSNKQVNVTTTGTVHSCGHAEVSAIGLP